MIEEPNKQPVAGLSDAIERAATALEHRIYMTETVMLPQAIERRNLGVAAVAREGLANDKAALEMLRAAAAKPESASDAEPLPNRSCSAIAEGRRS